MDNIYRIVYINLDSRTDRKEQIEDELKMLKIPSDKIERFNAIQNDKGYLGCTLSHISVLKRAKEEKWENVLIFEDDFCSNHEADKWEAKLQDVFREVSEYDVILFSYGARSKEKYYIECKETSVNKTISIQTASGYLVHRQFYDHLIHNFEEGYSNLINNPDKYSVYALDQYWKKLQPSSNWFHIIPSMGKQRGSFSNIENCFVDYGY